MKHKAKSFIAVLLALCLMMSLGVGALADNGDQGGGGPGGGDDPGGGETAQGGDKEDDGGQGDGDSQGDNTPAGVEGSNPPEPRVGEEYNINIAEDIVGGKVEVMLVVDPSSHSTDYNTTVANEGDWVTFSVSADTGYELVGKPKVISDEGNSEVTVNDTFEPGQYSFMMPASDVTISAVFQEKAVTPAPHTITVTSTPAEGGTVTVDKQTAQADETITFTVKPNEGYEIGSITGNVVATPDASEDGKFSFTMPDTDVTITVNFKELYAINVTTPDHGTVLTAPAARAAQGTPVTLSAVPDKGYELVGYTVTKDGGGAVTVTNGQFVMPNSAVTVTATFKKVEIPEPPVVETTHDVHIVNSEGGIVNANPGEAVKDTTIKLTSGSDYRHYFVGYKVWTESGKTVTVSNDSFTMPDEDVYVKGIFKLYQPTLDWHSIDVDKPYYSSVTVDSWAYETETVTFTVDTWYDYDYYSVSVWTDGGAKVSLSSLGNDKYSFTMPDDDVTIYVDYSYVGRYSITKDVEGDGSIYVRSSADHGDTVWIEAAPSAGQSLTSLRVFYGEPWAYGDKGYYGYWDEADVHYSEYWDAYYFTMPADDVVVYARFTDGATVDVIAGDHGDAKVSSRYAEKGDWVYITAYPDEGYEVDSVTVTDSLGRSVKVTELSYDYFLFTMPGTSVDVKVTFRAKDYDVFYDVSRGDWYYKAVRFVHEKGIMEGTGTHYFSPEADLSRGMLATILYRLEGSPSVSGYSGFSDVADTAYYAKAVAWAKANGIVNGVTATAYEPDTAVTREELAAILCRYAAFKGKDTAISYDYLAGFSDANTSHVYARPALNWAVAYDIINGQGNGVLAPRATATRAEVAQVLMNYLEVFD